MESAPLRRPDQIIPVWLDCDTGHDDAFAVLLAARTPDCRLLGISTVYGNAPLEKTTYNTRAILKAVGCEGVPVYAGAAKPLTREALHAPDIHGESGLDGTTCLPEPSEPAKTDKSATEAIYSALIAQEPGTAHLVAVGALTNIALLLAAHPDLVEHLGGLSIMGGAIGGGFTNAPMGKIEGDGERFGNYSPYAEFNIFIDPEAAHAVFSNASLAAKTTLVTLDLTHQFLATNRIQKELLLGSKVRGEDIDCRASVVEQVDVEGASELRRLFYEILTFFKKTYAEVFGLVEGAPVHDPLAVAAVLAPHLFYTNPHGTPGEDQSERFSVEIVTTGAQGSANPAENTVASSQLGRTIATVMKDGRPGVRIPRGLAIDELWKMLESALTRTEETLQAKS